MFINSMVQGTTWFSFRQNNAPQMVGETGLLDVLDACLVTGFGEKTVQTVSVKDGEITLDFGVSHGFLLKQVVRIDGDTALNGNHKIQKLTNNTITILSDVADVAGVITVKVAPLGFSKTGDKLRRVYQSTSKTSSKDKLELDMSEKHGFHDSVGVALVSAFGKKVFWLSKCTSNKTNPVNINQPSAWCMVGTGDWFYLFVDYLNNRKDHENHYAFFGFGEFVGLSDGTHPFIIGRNFTGTNFYTGENNLFSSTTGNNYAITVNTPTQSLGLFMCGVSSNAGNGSGSGGIAYPNPYGNAIFCLPVRCYAGNNVVGLMPSLLYVENNLNSQNFDGQIQEDLLLVSMAHYNGHEYNKLYQTIAIFLG